MPGCLKDARAVARGEFEELKTSERVSSTEGGDDCSRTVYRVGDVVYKLDGDRPDNELEFRILTDLSHYDWAPPVDLFHVDGCKVLCMPYYKNDSVLYSFKALHDIEDCLTSWMRQNGKLCPTGDMHYGNYRVTGPNQIMVIDAAGNFNL